MNNENLLQSIILSVVIALVVSFVVVSVAKPKIDFGGYTAGHWDSADGYKVDGTTVIDGDGNYDGAITASSAVVSSPVIQGGTVGIVGYGTTTVTAAQVCDYSVIRIGLLADPVAELTLPSTTTLHADCLSANGDHRTVLIDNEATSTMAMTIVAGSGIDLQEHVGEGDVVIGATEYARIRFTRITSATTTAEVINLQVGD